MKVRGCQLTVVSFFVAALLCRAELNVELSPEVESRFVYEPFTVLLKTGGAAETPEIPPAGGFSVAGVFPASMDGTNRNFRIEIIPEQAGTLTLPPFTVKAGDQTVQTQPFRFSVSAPRRATEMNLQLTLSSTNLYVDQPVRLTVTWNSDVPFNRCRELMLELPLLRNANWDVYPLDPGVPEKDRIGLPVDGQRMIARKTSVEGKEELTFEYQLIPRKAGIYPPTDARLSCALMDGRQTATQYPSYFDNQFFDTPDRQDRFERIWLTVPMSGISVQALPEEHRTVRYCGIVGDCTATVAIRPQTTTVGQPMMLTVELNNLAFGSQIAALPAAVLADTGSEFQITEHPMYDSATGHSRSFTYVLRPLRSGVDTVPALALQIFDPDRKAYRTVRTEPLHIQVEPDGGQTVYQPHLRNEQERRTPLSGIRGNRKESRVTMNTYRFFEIITRTAWLLWLLPPLFWLALRPWLRRRDRCRIDPAYARALRAVRRFRRTVKNDEQTAWKNYLADRFNLNADAITCETVTDELEKRNLNEELIREIRCCFSRQDTVTYSPRKSEKPCTEIRQLVRQIEKAAPLLLLAVCLLAPFRIHAAAPEQLFEQAMQIRAEKPDEAQPLFTEAALGFEADEQFLNAGNSWFFAGQNGRALANYLSAESLRPFNKQIRESIAFIRTQRTDVFQTLEKPATKFSKGWKRFCRWTPAIRFGLLTLVYLAGWIAFLIARFFGKRVPHRVWIAFGITALIPAASLIQSSFQPLEGVVIEPAEARLGPGYAYDKAYETPLHEATEFQWLDRRDGWVHARLPDKSDAWLRESACAQIK
ncbi:MAG: BatD family protein [Kiritimatiellales bacterium]